MYVKVKRHKTTMFLHIDLSETILEVKAKLQELVQKVGVTTCCACLHRTVAEGKGKPGLRLSCCNGGGAAGSQGAEAV